MKAKCSIKIETYLEVDDGWDDKCSMEQVMKQAKDHANNVTVLLQQGVAEPTRVRARITLEAVTLLPEE